MNPYVTGQTIQMLREKRRMTQKQLADLLYISDKTVSKWETGKGLPDIMLLEPLAKALHVSVPELFSGTEIVNQNRTGNMLKTRFYVCPVCGNVISAAGEGAFHCCRRWNPKNRTRRMTSSLRLWTGSITSAWRIP